MEVAGSRSSKRQPSSTRERWLAAEARRGFERDSMFTAQEVEEIRGEIIDSAVVQPDSGRVESRARVVITLAPNRQRRFIRDEER
jgi:hypothetical protein